MNFIFENKIFYVKKMCICKRESLNFILFFSSPFYPFLCRIRQMMFASPFTFYEKTTQSKGGIKTFDFRIFQDVNSGQS